MDIDILSFNQAGKCDKVFHSDKKRSKDIKRGASQHKKALKKHKDTERGAKEYKRY